jgi:hypothetical protein
MLPCPTGTWIIRRSRPCRVDFEAAVMQAAKVYFPGTVKYINNYIYNKFKENYGNILSHANK